MSRTEGNGAVIDVDFERHLNLTIESPDLPLPAGLVVTEVAGTEAVSALHELHVTVEELVPGALLLLDQQIIGQRLKVHIDRGSMQRRTTSGVISQVELVEHRRGDHTAQVLLTLVPRMWRLTQCERCAVFQDMTTRDIVSRVLARNGVPHRFEHLSETPVRSYTVQYRESDYAFVARILAQDGIGFRLAENADGEEVVFFDGQLELDGEASIDLNLGARARRGSLRSEVNELSLVERLRPGAVDSTGFDFRAPMHRPRRRVLARGSRTPLPPDAQLGPDPVHVPATERHTLRVTHEDEVALEVADHRGHLPADRVSYSATARLLEALRRDAASIRGRCLNSEVRVGRRISISGGVLRTQSEFVVTKVEVHARIAGAQEGSECAATFEASPAGSPVRPPRPQRRFVQALETATVVGPTGQSVHTDAHGRVRVRFPWDLEERDDGEPTSAWIRTMQSWSGPGFGTQWIPRVGMEVIVGFLDGDPDRPIVLGAAPNGVNATPFALPGDAARSGLRTRTLGGTGWNELSFGDSPSGEEVRLRAQRDLIVDVIGDHREHVRGRRDTRISAETSSLTEGSAELRYAATLDLHVAGGVNEVFETSARRDIRGSMEVRAGTARVEVGGRSSCEVAGDDELVVRGRRSVHVAGDVDELLERDRKTRVGGRLATTVDGVSVGSLLGGLAFSTGTVDEPRPLHALSTDTATLEASKTLHLTSAEAIVLTCGASQLRIGPDGIEIQAESITLRADRVKAEGDDVAVVAHQTATVRGNTVVATPPRGGTLELSADADLNGERVRLGPANAQRVGEERPAAVPITRIFLTDQSGAAMPGARYEVRLPDGRLRTGFLDVDGRAELHDLEAAGELSFPEVHRVSGVGEGA